MHPDRCRPDLILFPVFRFVAIPKNIGAVRLRVVGVDVAKFHAEMRCSLYIVNTTKVSVNVKIVFAEGRHL